MRTAVTAIIYTVDGDAESLACMTYVAADQFGAAAAAAPPIAGGGTPQLGADEDLL